MKIKKPSRRRKVASREERERGRGRKIIQPVTKKKPFGERGFFERRQLKTNSKKHTYPTDTKKKYIPKVCIRTAVMHYSK